MANRSAYPLPRSSPEATIAALLDVVRRLTLRVELLESRSGQSLPGDYRFTLADDGTVLVRRVSTGDECALCGGEGEPGPPGPSAYEVAVDDGFVGDESAWLASLHGADGADGADGATGPAGPSAVSTDAGNVATLGTDALVYVGAAAVSTLPVVSTAVDLTLDATHGIVRATAACTITLPTAAGIAGRCYTIDADAATVIVTGTGGELIEGAATQIMAAPSAMTVYSTGSAWRII